MVPCADAFAAAASVLGQLQQPCRIWSVREALSYSGLCEVRREQGTTSLTAPNELTGEDETIEVSPKGRRQVHVRARTRKAMKPRGEARKVEKLLGGIRFRALPLSLM